ncbi:hypothetical protein DM02DRAFT_706113 [Periconia macrospinosa]|uniref:Ecp2 effector protein-like domain-containing protein n=1 Tax=Periconia macrospinosa TaxID=97972 RepID=A0A2V1DTC3_9PLEO|nr:hypothetical protein DM02DRAFT_706113 [Periconia macrospinosa]
MVISLWLISALGAASLSFYAEAADSGFRFISRSTGQHANSCPVRCNIAGPSPGNWSVYSDFKFMQNCRESVFQDFSLYDNVDNNAEQHHIRACTSFGPDFAQLKTVESANQPERAKPTPVKFEMGWWEDVFGRSGASIRSIIKQLRWYSDRGFGATDRPFIIFAQADYSTVGLYIGQGLLNQALSASALKTFEDNFDRLNGTTPPSLAMQLCGPEYDAAHTFGVMVNSNRTFAPAQNAIKTWASGACLHFSESTIFDGQAVFTTPLQALNSNAVAQSSVTTDEIEDPKVKRFGEKRDVDTSRNGNWIDFSCNHTVVTNRLKIDPSEQWKLLDADGAWADIVRIYRDTDKKEKMSFSASFETTTQVGSSLDCQSIGEKGNSCNAPIECGKGPDGPHSGAAAWLIFNSLAFIHQLHKDYQTKLFQAATLVSMSLKDLENKFAPIPPKKDDDAWKTMLIDLLSLGTLSTVAPFFNAAIKNMPHFANGKLANSKDTSLTLIGEQTNKAKDFRNKDTKDKWTPESQDAFSSYMANAIYGWSNATNYALNHLFDGSEESLDILWKAISDGKLIKGKCNNCEKNNPSDADLRGNIEKSIFGFAIPNLWKMSQAYAFVIDSGATCNTANPIKEYMSEEDMKVAGACVNERLYFLASPEGKARECKQVPREKGGNERRCTNQKFKPPKGLQYLDGTNFGRITKEILIKGSLNSHAANNHENGAKQANPNDKGVIDGLFDVDVTIPGFIRLPVCTPSLAYKSWDTAKRGDGDNYPCDFPRGKDLCGDSSYEDKTGSSKASINDCKQIIANIRPDGGSQWTTQVVGKKPREILKAGTCHFSVHATKTGKNLDFKIGGEDVMSTINIAISKFGKDGKIGAEGFMDCNGNAGKQAIGWKIY